MQKNFYVPLIIPMSHSGHIDYVALDRHLSQLIMHGTKGIILHRTLSELDMLSHDETHLLCRYVQAFCSGTCEVIFDISADSLDQTIQHLRYAQEHGINRVYVLLHSDIGYAEYEAYVLVESISQLYAGNIIVAIEPDHTPISLPILRKMSALENVCAIATTINDAHSVWYYKRKLPALNQLIHMHTHHAPGYIPHCQPTFTTPLANIIPERISKVCDCIQQHNPQAAAYILAPYSRLLGRVNDAIDAYLLKTILQYQGIITGSVGCRATPNSPWLQRYIAKQHRLLSLSHLSESSYA